MIRVTVEYTDNLGPEADIPALLGKIAAMLRAERPDLAAHDVRIAGHKLTDYVIGDAGDHWAWLEAAVCAPPEASDGVGVRERLLALVEAHLAELYPRRSICVTVRPQAAPEDVLEVVHQRPADADEF